MLSFVTTRALYGEPGEVRAEHIITSDGDCACLTVSSSYEPYRFIDRQTARELAGWLLEFANSPKP